MREVTDKQVTEAITAVVAEVGRDFVYVPPGGVGEMCRYEHEGAASCLVGRVLKRLGATLQDLRECESAGSVGTEVARRCGLSISIRALNALYTAQQAQDHGATWGKALADYLMYL